MRVSASKALFTSLLSIAHSLMTTAVNANFLDFPEMLIEICTLIANSFEYFSLKELVVYLFLACVTTILLFSVITDPYLSSMMLTNSYTKFCECGKYLNLE